MSKFTFTRFCAGFGVSRGLEHVGSVRERKTGFELGPLGWLARVPGDGVFEEDASSGRPFPTREAAAEHLLRVKRTREGGCE